MNARILRSSSGVMPGMSMVIQSAGFGVHGWEVVRGLSGRRRVGEVGERHGYTGISGTPGRAGRPVANGLLGGSQQSAVASRACCRIWRPRSEIWCSPSPIQTDPPSGSRLSARWMAVRSTVAAARMGALLLHPRPRGRLGLMGPGGGGESIQRSSAVVPRRVASAVRCLYPGACISVMAWRPWRVIPRAWATAVSVVR